MDDLISREELRRRMYHEAFETDNGMQRWDSGLWIRYKIFENAIEEAEPAQKNGEWVRKEVHSNWDDWTEYTCSLCGATFKRLYKANFCPNCGAQMGERKEDD